MMSHEPTADESWPTTFITPPYLYPYQTTATTTEDASNKSSGGGVFAAIKSGFKKVRRASVETGGNDDDSIENKKDPSYVMTKEGSKKRLDKASMPAISSSPSSVADTEGDDNSSHAGKTVVPAIAEAGKKMKSFHVNVIYALAHFTSWPVFFC